MRFSVTYNACMRPPYPELLGFLSPYDRSIVELALAMRALMLEEAPSAIETIYDAYSAVALGYSFTGRLKDGFCHVAVYTGHVNLGFNRGAELPDPQSVLQGSGKKIRHVRIERLDDLDKPWLRRYVRAAIRQVGGPLAPAVEGHSIVKAIYAKKRRPAPPRSDSPPRAR
jgi:hypothetical protein